MSARAVKWAALLVALSAASARAQEPVADAGTPDAAVQGPSESPQTPASPELTPPAAPPPELLLGGESLQMSAEELEALGLDATSGTGHPKIDLSLQISGFVDVGFGVQLTAKDSANRATGAAPPHSTFYVGNFNIYLAKQLSETVRMMSEVRLTYLPNGSSAFGLQTRTDTTTYDYTDFGRATRWGGIILQRVYIEWNPHQLFGARVGQFLTPYGVWNVDHGSPVYIPVKRPWSIGVGWIPEKQTGIELYGRATPSRSHALGYHLTVSNGTGPISDYADLDENKAVGARAFWEYYGLGRLRVGASAYYGRETNAVQKWQLGSGGTQRSREEISSQFDTLTWAGDVTWNLGDLHVQSEWITNQRKYTTKGRKQYTVLSGNNIIPVDVLSWGGYVLVGYRLPWLGIMPYFVSEKVKGDLLQLKMKLYTLQYGLNIRPIESVVIKVSLESVYFQLAGAQNLHVVQSQIAWAF